jgi:hypothetical protein
MEQFKHFSHSKKIKGTLNKSWLPPCSCFISRGKTYDSHLKLEPVNTSLAWSGEDSDLLLQLSQRAGQPGCRVGQVAGVQLLSWPAQLLQQLHRLPQLLPKGSSHNY